MLLTPYVYDPRARTLTFPGASELELKHFRSVRNKTSGRVLYLAGDAGASVSGNVLTLPVPYKGGGDSPTDAIDAIYDDSFPGPNDGSVESRVSSAVRSFTKEFRPANGTPVLATPSITDSPIAVIGMTRDRKTLIGSTATSPYQLHYSTDDGRTWSAGLLNTGDVNRIAGAVETPHEDLYLVYEGSRFLSKATGWRNRTMAGGGVTSTGLMSLRASGVYARPQWGVDVQGELSLLVEYGAKTNATLTDNARYAFMSKDEVKFVKIFDLQANDGSVPGLGINPVSGGYHCHAIAYDPWANRVWITGGDFNDWIVYSDDVADLNIVDDIATTSASKTITSAATNRTTFTSRHVGMPIRGNGIPAGATIESVTDFRTAVLSVEATATATGVLVNFGPITWEVFHYGRSGRWQVVGIIPAPEGVYFGGDGYPTGFHISRRGPSNVPGKLENVLATGPYKTGVGQHLQYGSYRAPNNPDAPVLISACSNDTDMGGYLAIVHPSGRKAWKVWDDPWKVAFESIQQVYHTASGNIVGQIKSGRTPSGYQLFRVPMPELPSASDL